MAAKNDRRAADVAEDVEWILRWEPQATARKIAERLGYKTKSGLQYALKPRPDLLAILKRNAELEGHTVRRRAS